MECLSNHSSLGNFPSVEECANACRAHDSAWHGDHEHGDHEDHDHDEDDHDHDHDGHDHDHDGHDHKDHEGCQFFSYGPDGDCRMEDTDTAACTEGFEPSSSSFYEPHFH